MIFLLGLHKTGTSSLDEALRILGYPKCVQGIMTFKEGMSDEDYQQGMLDNVGGHECFRGFPWCMYPAFLRDSFPGAKFILTVRDLDSWYASVAKNWKGQHVPIHDYFYGTNMTADQAEKVYRDRYQEHFAECVEAFSNSPSGTFLIMDIVSGHGWETLCPFLGADIPNDPFPHTNKTPP